MNRQNRRRSKPLGPLQKKATGIPGFDEITHGGLPAGRPTLVCGSAGAGKTLFAMEFLVRGAVLYNEPGVFISFEETDEERLAKEKEFDVVLSDISMPEMDGFQFLNKLRELPGGENMPAVALTGFGRPEDVQRAVNEGFYAHLTKPFNLQTLATLLQKLPRKQI